MSEQDLFRETAALSFKAETLGIRRNLERILKACNEAAADGKSMLFTPELSVTGKDCADMLLSAGFLLRVRKELKRFAENLPAGFLVGVGLPLPEGLSPLNTDELSLAELYPDSEGDPYSRDERVLFNAYVLLADGKVIASVRGGLVSGRAKRGDDSLRYFASGDLLRRYISKNEFCFEFKGRRIAVIAGDADAVCAEIKKSGKECDFAVIPDTHDYCCDEDENKALGKAFDTVSLLKIPAVYINASGTDGGSSIRDGRCLFTDEKGKILSLSKRFPFNAYSLVYADDPVYESCSKYDCMLTAVAAGMFERMVRTGSKGFALSMSGGADSALCSVCASLAQIKALLDLGVEEYTAVLKALKLPLSEEKYAKFYDACIKAASGRKIFDDSLNQFEIDALISALKEYVIPEILICAYQGSAHSGSVTFNAAKEMSKGVGARFVSWSVAPMIQEYTDTVSEALGTKFTWDKDDTALQNIQARSRLPGIWLLANHKGFLLLATSNLSEASVGYCTMDGDTAGGLSPIAGIGKSVILKINRHIMHEGISLSPFGLKYNIPEIRYIVAQAPTAELRPGGEQTDEKDLMPYPLLDTIRKLFAVHGLMPSEIRALLTAPDGKFKEVTAGLSSDEISLFIDRYFRLFQRNQWKRERYATGFKIEYDNASPKSFLRFPELSVLLTETEKE